MSTATNPAKPAVAEADRKLAEFRESVRIGRHTARMSQSQLAAATGKSQVWMSKVESGSLVPLLIDAIVLAEILRPALGRNIMEVFCDV